MNKITLVTGLWDLGRNELSEGWSRSYEHYLNKFSELLKTESNLIIFGDEKLRDFVFERRSKENTTFIVRDLDWFKNNDYYDKIQSIRNKPEWYNQVGWLSESTQARLELYNPLVMSKMFLLHDAKILDPFDSDYMFWIDAGLTNTVHPGYFTHDKVLDKLSEYTNKFSFVCFPYKTESEIHGFEIKKLNQIAGSSVEKVARGGFFGGPKSKIAEVNSIYYGLLLSTLSDEYMGTEESIFSIMCYKHANIINHFDIEANGLLSTFFENLKNDALPKNEIKLLPSDISKVGLYVLTFNSPEQFRQLIKSMLDYDRDFIDKPQKFLLDNSTDSSTTPIYVEICEEYGFEHIKVDNVGICGGRQWIAEHFETSDNDYMFFFEDDMFFYTGKETACRNGFNRYANNLYRKSLEIIQKNNFDFLKLNFSEFYGDNSTQWAWYNVPQNIREIYWPDNNKLPEQGLSPNAPKAEYKNIHNHDGLPYVTGEIYYCNWPQVVSKKGSEKMFLDTKWAYPYEQTWMSHMFQLTKDGKLNPALLLLTPTEHNRFDFYDGSLRKEN